MDISNRSSAPYWARYDQYLSLIHISKEMLKRRIPPATRSESTLMLNRFSIMFPVIAKKRAIKHASVTDFFAISFFFSFVISLVREMKVTTPLMGLTTTRMVVNV